MKAAVLTASQEIEIQERKVPRIGMDDVLIRVRHAGICGSDLAYYQYGHIGSQVVKYPLVLGHECGGEVVQIGSGVRRLRVGDLVALEPQKSCGTCKYCRTGLYNLCPDVVFMATPPNDGAFSEFVAHPEAMTFNIPAKMGTMKGALVEPLSLGVHISSQADARFGKSILILGAGSVGIATLIALKAMGMTDINVVEVSQKRLLLARRLGAKGVFDAKDPNMMNTILEAFSGEGADIVIETSGSETATEQAVDLVRRGGRIVLVGYAKEKVSFDFRKLIMKEAYISTSRRYRHVYPLAIKMISEDLAPVEEMVTHHFSFDDIPRAFEFAIANRAEMLKGMIDFQA
jgi:L-iditol 2-dehydrogenase